MITPDDLSNREAQILRSVERRGVVWAVRIGADRGRLELVVIVPPSSTPTIVPALSDSEVRELLADAPAQLSTGWACRECGVWNDRERRWCRSCSAHGSAHA